MANQKMVEELKGKNNNVFKAKQVCSKDR